jgi:hypothetical protein
VGALPGSELDPNACQEIVTDASIRRTNFKGGGAARLRVRSNGAVAKDSPVLVSLEARGRAVRTVELQLDGHRLGSHGKPGRLSAALLPKALANTRNHLVTGVITPRKGAARTLVVKIRSIACATRFTAGQWRTTKGTALRLRIDSRRAVQSATFAVPSKFRIRAGARRVVGRLRIVSAPGTSKTLNLRAPAGKRSGALLTGAGVPTVTFTSRRITVSTVPGKTGIVELTLYWDKGHGPAMVARRRHPTFKASLTTVDAPAKSLRAALKRLTAR